VTKTALSVINASKLARKMQKAAAKWMCLAERKAKYSVLVSIRMLGPVGFFGFGDLLLFAFEHDES
jgi:hypothetical protein